MKKLFRSSLFWMVMIEIVAVIILALLGFKITYAPTLDNNWDAISAVAGWVGAIATICIPIVVVFFQHKLDQNKNDIGEANKATLLELKKFKDTYSDIFEAIKNGKEITFDCGGAPLGLTEQNLLDYIRATINITAYDAAVYFDVSKDQTVAMLDRLVEEKVVLRTDVDGVGVYSLYK